MNIITEKDILTNFESIFQEAGQLEDIKLTTAITKQSRLMAQKEEDSDVLTPVNTYTIPKTALFLHSK
jgi:hypothetical protein